MGRRIQFVPVNSFRHVIALQTPQQGWVRAEP